MKKRCFCLFLLCSILLICSSPSSACRFWVASSKKMPDLIVREQLLSLPHSLKQLGHEYKDGWSVAFFKGPAALIARSEKSSISDERFDQAVEAASNAHAEVVIGHLRLASSGCQEGVANPHPFQRYDGGHHWLFGHNGGLNKELLISLISEDYLKAHPPEACKDNPPESWVDSELYFIYILKKIDEAKGNVLNGLKSAVSELAQHIKDEDQYLNFFLTDGKEVWAYKKGMSLFYAYDQKNRLSIISSAVPGEDQFEWKEFPEDNFALLRPNRKPKFYASTK